MSKRATLREKRRRQRQQRRIITIAIVVGAALTITGLLIFPSLKPVGDFVTPDPNPRPFASGSTMGKADAPVVIEEFSDFNCHFCADFHATKLDRIVEEYVEPGTVRIVFHNYAFLRQDSVTAAHASLCARDQDKFWEYADIMFANQAMATAEGYGSALLSAYAEAIGLDVPAFKSCMRSNDHRPEIQADLQLGSASGVASTPSFLVNGLLIVGSVSYEEFQTAIEAALASETPPSP